MLHCCSLLYLLPSQLALQAPGMAATVVALGGQAAAVRCAAAGRSAHGTKCTTKPRVRADGNNPALGQRRSACRPGLRRVPCICLLLHRTVD